MQAASQVPEAANEPVLGYAPGSAERVGLERTLKELGSVEPLDLTMTIAGRQRLGGGQVIDVVQPHRHSAVLGTMREALPADVQDAIDAARAAAPDWRASSFEDRAGVLLRAADLLAGPWRATMNAATMLGQSKTATQAEIDSACELIDFLRFNVVFGHRLLAEQPLSSPGVWNRMDHRPLEGFVLAITPFNFTAIAANLPLAPALMGNTVVWKPSPTQQYAAHVTMRLLEAAGLPPGVVNMVTGTGGAVSEVAVRDEHLAGIHFTGSTATFQQLWTSVGSNIAGYRTYPRLVGETGGKDFVLAHASADVEALEVALVRGAFEYQGQKCSAASRAYIPRSVWEGGLRDGLAERTASLTYGDVTDLSCFGGAVIDRRSFDRLAAVVRGAEGQGLKVLVGGQADDSEGYFVQPTVVVGEDPRHEYFTREFFGPVLSVFVYEDRDWAETLSLVDEVAPYALTGAVFAQDAYAVAEATEHLRFAAGNFYINDKPTGAVVGQQPFGGARASGTNDKAGSVLNLLRWTSPRTVKETFVPPHDHTYPHMS